MGNWIPWLAPMGLPKRLSRYGEEMQERKLSVEEVQARLDNYHEPIAI